MPRDGVARTLFLTFLLIFFFIGLSSGGVPVAVFTEEIPWSIRLVFGAWIVLLVVVRIVSRDSRRAGQ